MTTAPTQTILDITTGHNLTFNNVCAQDVLKHYKYEGQRRIRPTWVKALAAAIERGEMLFLEYRTAECAGRRYLIDGQHRMTAFASMPGILLPSSYTNYVVPDMNAVGRLYATYDRGKQRTYEDMFEAFELVQSIGIPNKEARNLNSATPLLMTGFEPAAESGTGAQISRSVQSRATCMLDWAEEMRHYVHATAGQTMEIRNYTRHSAMLAVALVTIRYQGQRALDFWRDVAQDIGAPDSPSRTLLVWFRDATRRRGMHAYQVARYVATAWNAYHNGRPVKKLIVKDLGLPIVLDGTEYSYNRRTGGGYRVPRAVLPILLTPESAAHD